MSTKTCNTPGCNTTGPAETFHGRKCKSCKAAKSRAHTASKPKKETPLIFYGSVEAYSSALETRNTMGFGKPPEREAFSSEDEFTKASGVHKECKRKYQAEASIASYHKRAKNDPTFLQNNATNQREARARSPERFAVSDRRYAQSHSVERKALARDYRERHRDRLKTYDRERRTTEYWAAKYADPHYRAKKKAYRAANMDSIAAYRRQWQRENPREGMVEYLRNYRLRLKDAVNEGTVPVTFTAFCQKAKANIHARPMWNLQEGHLRAMFEAAQCAYCATECHFENGECFGIDRIDSSRNYDADNVVLCCRLCNWMKKDMPSTILFGRAFLIIEWLTDDARTEVLGCSEECAIPDESKCKRKAAALDIDYNLTPAEFLTLTLSPCFYCGESGPGGIDRLDSNGSYVNENCVPCCKHCNFFKNDLPVEQFYKHLFALTAEHNSPEAAMAVCQARIDVQQASLHALHATTVEELAIVRVPDMRATRHDFEIVADDAIPAQVYRLKGTYTFHADRECIFRNPKATDDRLEFKSWEEFPDTLRPCRECHMVVSQAQHDRYTNTRDRAQRHTRQTGPTTEDEKRERDRKRKQEERAKKAQQENRNIKTHMRPDGYDPVQWARELHTKRQQKYSERLARKTEAMEIPAEELNASEN